MTQSLTLRRPDDWHLHLRDGAMLRASARLASPSQRLGPRAAPVRQAARIASSGR